MPPPTLLISLTICDRNNNTKKMDSQKMGGWVGMTPGFVANGGGGIIVHSSSGGSPHVLAGGGGA